MINREVFSLFSFKHFNIFYRVNFLFCRLLYNKNILNIQNMGFTLLTPFKNVAYCNVFYFLTVFALWSLVVTIISGGIFLFGSKNKLSFGAIFAYIHVLFWVVIAYIQQRTLYSMCVNSVGSGMGMAEKVQTIQSPKDTGGILNTGDYLL